MGKIRAVLFDFDGTLADSMEDNFIAWQYAFREFGAEISQGEYFLLEGTVVSDVARIIGMKHNISSANYSEIVKLKNEYYLKNHKFSLFPGALELVNLLKQNGKKIGIVSASPKEKLEKTVPKEFSERFDVIISGDDYKKGKPDPEPYQLAMNRLEVFPNETVIIENAPLGIRSAKLAGAYCIALTTTLKEDYLKEADKVVDNFKELEYHLSMIK